MCAVGVRGIHEADGLIGYPIVGGPIRLAADHELAKHASISSLAARLGAIRGVEAVVLGGSHARGRAQPGSDIDLGLLYSDAAPFAVESIRELAESVNDRPAPVVTGFYEWALG